jgi:dTDP-4-dehydrorhamnose 3,5-epimerase
LKVVRTAIPGVLLIEPLVHQDPRGFFLEAYHASRYAEAGIPGVFVQDNHSSSRRGVLRGLHAQRRRPQGKLLRVVRGEIWDVAVDVRRGSPSFGRHVAERLSAENFRQLYVPPGFAHGFVVLSEEAEVEYKCTEFYDRDDEFAIRWNDPVLAVPWPVSEPTLSEKDRRAPPLAEIEHLLPRYEDLGA